MISLKRVVILGVLIFQTSLAVFAQNIFLKSDDVQSPNIYHEDWIDFNKNGKKDAYEDPDTPINNRIEDLLSQMNLNEKTAQLVTLYGYGRVLKDELPTEDWSNEVWIDGLANIDEHLNGVARHTHAQTQYSASPSLHARAINETQKFFVEKTRLGIPVEFTNEGIRGLCHDSATGFPSQIGLGSTWDKDLIHEIGKVTGREAKLSGYTNVYSPVLDLARDPRWGRVVECYSEDPYLVSEYGKKMVEGIQSQGVASTAKHFAIYSVPKGGRDGDVRTDPQVTLREVHQMYLRPFREVVTESNLMGIMSSYNDYDGIPVSASSLFLNDILRDEWGFKGYVVSDSWAIGGLEGRHKVAENFKESIYQAVSAGLNVRTNFTPPADFLMPLRELIAENRLSEELIDDRVRDLLRVKFSLGLFDTPYVTNPELADKIVGGTKHHEISLRASRESIVLLKNEGVLPLDKNKISSLLVTGPNAKDIEHSISRYGPSNIAVTSLYEGIKSLVGDDIKLEYSKGCDFFDDNWPRNEIIDMEPSAIQQAMIDEAVRKAKDVDAIVIAVGDNYETVGESRSRTSLDLPGNQIDLVRALYKTSKPIVVVLINGRPLSINWINEYIPGVIEAWNPGPHGGTAIAEALFGDLNPGGKISVTFPKSVGQIPYNFPFKRNSQAGQPIEGPNGRGNTRVNGVIYPFGHGLSYTTFEYSDLEVIGDLTLDENLEIGFAITNTGMVAGDEVVQLYISDEFSSVVTYESVLRGFTRLSLEPGKTEVVKMKLTAEDLSLLNKEMKYVAEEGMFKIKIGSSSEDIRLESIFNLSDNLTIKSISKRQK